MNLAVLAVQEVEDVDTLALFAHQELESLGYRHVVLVEGNDPRLIDVGLLSRLPLGAVTSWRHAVHPGSPDQPVFSRDLLEVEVLNERRTKRLFTLYNTHLKSHFVSFGQDPVAGAAAANERRRQQAESAARIVSARMRPNSTFLVVGDMNDAPDAEPLAPLLSKLPLTDGLADALEDRPAPEDTPCTCSPLDPSLQAAAQARPLPALLGCRSGCLQRLNARPGDWRRKVTGCERSAGCWLAPITR